MSSTEPMDIDDTERPSMDVLPVEILYHVFPYLPTVEMMRCRRVCSVWQAVVDAVTRRDEFWQRRCMSDHPSSYEQARAKCSPDLTWRQLYQSLHLWIKFYDAEETLSIMCFADLHAIDTAYLYKDFFVIHSGSRIVYCDKEMSITVKKRIRIGIHQLFGENDHIAYFLSPNTDLCIVPKSNEELLFDQKVIVPDVYCYEIIGKDVYYVKSLEEEEHKIFVAKCSDNYRCTELIDAPLPIWGLSYYKDCLHIMVGGYNVYKIVNNNSEHVNEESNIFGTLKYGFPYDVSLKSKSKFEDTPSLATSMGIDFKITCMFFYNNLIFTGSDKGLLNLYDAEELATNITASPLVEYNIAEMCRIGLVVPQLVPTYNIAEMFRFGLVVPRLVPTSVRRNFTLDMERNNSMSICGIDVVERENGHTVYVATQTNIVKLDLTHYSHLGKNMKKLITLF